MPRFLLALVSALWCSSICTASSVHQPDRVGFSFYGPVKIGMTRGELESALGARLELDGLETEGCQYYSARGHDDVAFMLIDNRLARVDISGKGIKTVSGVQVGSAQKSVIATYPRIQITPHHYAAPDGSYLTLYSRDRKYGIRFETDNHRVVMYYIGTAEAVQYVEGCL